MSERIASDHNDLSAIRAAVEETLRGEVDRLQDGDSNGRFRELRQMLAYHMGWEGPGAGPEAQGKRIRPLLVSLACAAAGADWRAALPAAAAVELLHNFSLIHDDIQDRSPLRRGRPTLWTLHGVAQAINAGDLMFTLANAALLRLGDTLPAEAALRAARLFQDTCVRLTHGQYLDMRFETAVGFTQADYWVMVGGKTAALLEACMALGALAAGAGEAALGDWMEFGRGLGCAFQAQDDWLGIWGDSAATGKSVASDLVTGKKTLPVLYALSLAESAFARRWGGQPVPPEQVAVAAAALDADGAGRYTLEQAERQTELALQALQRAAVPGPARQALEDLARQLLRRSA